MPEVDAIRARLVEMLRKPPNHDCIPHVEAVRKFKATHAAAAKTAAKSSATAQQLISALETLRGYIDPSRAA